MLKLIDSSELNQLRELCESKRKNGGITIEAYKCITFRGRSPLYPGVGIKYFSGKRIAVKNADTSPMIECGRGINLGTLYWCERFSASSDSGFFGRIMRVHFRVRDVAVIPTYSYGKLRVFKCRVIEPHNVVLRLLSKLT